MQGAYAAIARETPWNRCVAAGKMKRRLAACGMSVDMHACIGYLKLEVGNLETLKRRSVRSRCFGVQVVLFSQPVTSKTETAATAKVNFLLP